VLQDQDQAILIKITGVARSWKKQLRKGSSLYNWRSYALAALRVDITPKLVHPEGCGTHVDSVHQDFGKKDQE